MVFRPPTVQRPRVPIWVVSAWPSERSMDRALRYDGVLAAAVGGDVGPPGVTPETVRNIREYAKKNGRAELDIVREGRTPGEDPTSAASIVRPYAEAGATWWIESPWAPPNAPEDLSRRIRQGPPRVAQGPQEADRRGPPQAAR